MSLLLLPDDVLREVIKFLGMVDTCSIVQTCTTVRALVDVPLLHQKRMEFTPYFVMLKVLNDNVRVAHEALRLIEEQADVECHLDAKGKCALSRKLTEVEHYHRRNERAATPFAEQFYYQDRNGNEILTWDECFSTRRQAPQTFTKFVLDAWRAVATKLRLALQFADTVKLYEGTCHRCSIDGALPHWSQAWTLQGDIMPFFNSKLADAKEGVAMLVAQRNQVAYLKSPPFPIECFTVRA